MLMIKIYFSKRIKSKISRGKGPRGQSGRKQAEASKSPLPVESHGTGLIPPATSCDNKYKVLSTGKLIRDAMPKVFIGG